MQTDLVDPFGRIVKDLRISITDRCNFRCTYCMPAEGMQWVPRNDLLSFEEIERISRVCVEHFGFTGIRLTGGEPTVRAHLPVLVERLAKLTVPSTGQAIDLAMTTNGATFGLMAHELRAAGLRRVNISIDSLHADRFQQLTRRNELHRVLDGIAAAQAAGFDPVKLNVVLMRGINDDEVIDFARFGRDHKVGVRFIEFMPLDADHGWTNEQVVTQDEIVARINEVFPIEAVERGNAPAERFRYLDGAGDIGVIPSVTKPFCGTCDRVRLTAEGQFRTCLSSVDEFDLRAIMRSGGTDDELAAEIARAVGTKWAGHAINQVHFIRPARSMSQIGG